MASAATSNHTASTSRKRTAVAANLDDIARFGQDAHRGLYLVKLPVAVAKAWREKFEHGGIETIGQTGEGVELEPRVELGTIVGGNGKFEHGAVIRLEDLDGKQMQYGVNLRPLSGMQMRVISAEVGDHGHNVKFEGMISEQGHLAAMVQSQDYKDDLRKRVAEAEVKTQVHVVSEKEAREMQSQQGRRIIKGNGKSKDDDDDDDAELVSKKAKGKVEGGTSRKVKKSSKKGADAAGETKTSKKVPRPKERVVDPALIREILIKCFLEIDPTTNSKRSHWKQKDLRKKTKIQLHRMAPILEEICDFNTSGPFAKTYSLKPGVTLAGS